MYLQRSLQNDVVSELKNYSELNMTRSMFLDRLRMSDRIYFAPTELG